MSCGLLRASNGKFCFLPFWWLADLSNVIVSERSHIFIVWERGNSCCLTKGTKRGGNKQVVLDCVTVCFTRDAATPTCTVTPFCFVSFRQRKL